jgi:hypothetical protein
MILEINKTAPQAYLGNSPLIFEHLTTDY